MTPLHSIPEEMFDALAAGRGGAAAIDLLWRAQHSRRLILLERLVNRLGPEPERNAAVEAIIAADHRNPAARRVLVEPMVGLWAADSLRRLAAAPRPELVAERVRGLGGLAAAATLVAGTSAELTAPALGGWLHLPGLGRVRTSTAAGPVRIIVEHGRLLVDDTEIAPGADRWQPRRWIALEPGGPRVNVEDLDPNRDTYHIPTADRLSPAEFEDWSDRLGEAWRLLLAYAPEQAAEIGAGLHSLVPLRRPLANAAHSATAKEAVGVVGLDLPRTGADFVVALVHEFSHSKLSSLLDVIPLHHPDTSNVFFAPWRTDPRPISGLLQGTYAFLGVARAWAALAAEPDRFPQAEREFAQRRAQVTDALRTLAGAGLLTSMGRRFLDGMTGAVRRLLEVPVRPSVEKAAQQLLERRRAAWSGPSTAAPTYP